MTSNNNEVEVEQRQNQKTNETRVYNAKELFHFVD